MPPKSMISPAIWEGIKIEKKKEAAEQMISKKQKKQNSQTSKNPDI